MQRMGKTRDKVFPLAGRVLLDGQPANFKKASQKLIVMLNDPAHPEAPLGARPFVECGRDGRFTFNSYLEGDGVPYRPLRRDLRPAHLQKKTGALRSGRTEKPLQRPG